MIRNNRSLIACLAGSALIVVKMYTGNNMFLGAFLGLTLVSLLLDKPENKIIYIIYYSTWAYILKFDMRSHSMFVFISLAYIFSVLMFSNKEIMNSIKRNGKSTNLAAFFMVYSFMFSIIGGAMPADVLGVLLNYASICFGIYLVRDRGMIKKYIMAYAVSMLVQCVITYIGLNFVKPIGDFLSFRNDLTLITSTGIQSRFRGFDNDPNYFSVEILVAVSTLFLYIIYEKKKLIPIAIAVSLAAFGLLTVSKMYLITIGLTAVLAVVLVSRRSPKAGIGSAVILAAAIFIVYKSMGEQVISAFTSRLESGQDLSQLTTGRNDAWLEYIDAIWESPRILFFGAGYGSGFYNRHAAHNGYLTLLYFWGIMGSIVYVLYIKNLYKSVYRSLAINEKISLINALPLATILIVNFALDCPIMDFFPIGMFLVIISRYFNKIE